MKTYNFGQFNSIMEFSKKFNTQKKCIRFLEKELWGDKIPTSPFDPTSKVYKRGDVLYRCKNTGKNFSIISNTFMGGVLRLDCLNGFMPFICKPLIRKG